MKKALIQLHIAVFLWGFTGVLGRLISLFGGECFLRLLRWLPFGFFSKNLKEYPLKMPCGLVGLAPLLPFIGWLFTEV